MWYTAVDDVGSRNPALASHHTALDFWNHAACNGSVIKVFLNILDVDALNQRFRVVYITQNARNIGELDEFFGLEGYGDFCGPCSPRATVETTGMKPLSKSD